MAKKAIRESMSVEYVHAFALCDVIADRNFNVSRSEADYAPENPEIVALVESLKSFGWSPDEPMLITRTPDGRHLLDAHFRLFTAATIAGLMSAPAMIYHGNEDDTHRRDRNACENAYVPPSWQGQAAQVEAMISAGFKPADVAKRLLVSKDHALLLGRTRKGIAALVSHGIIPAVEADVLPLQIAKELVQFPRTVTEDEKARGLCDIGSAWNAFQKNGKLPSREAKNSGGRAPGHGGWSKREGFEALSQSDLTVRTVAGGKRGCMPWVELATLLPPKGPMDIARIELIFTCWEEGRPLPHAAPETSPHTADVQAQNVPAGQSENPSSPAAN